MARQLRARPPRSGLSCIRARSPIRIPSRFFRNRREEGVPQPEAEAVEGREEEDRRAGGRTWCQRGPVTSGISVLFNPALEKEKTRGSERGRQGWHCHHRGQRGVRWPGVRYWALCSCRWDKWFDSGWGFLDKLSQVTIYGTWLGWPCRPARRLSP